MCIQHRLQNLESIYSRKLASQLLTRWPAGSPPMTEPGQTPYMLQFLQSSFSDLQARKGATRDLADLAGTCSSIPMSSGRFCAYPAHSLQIWCPSP